MSNKPVDDLKKPNTAPKAAEAFVQPEPDELSDSELERAAGGAAVMPGCTAASRAHDGG